VNLRDCVPRRGRESPGSRCLPRAPRPPQLAPAAPLPRAAGCRPQGTRPMPFICLPTCIPTERAALPHLGKGNRGGASSLRLRRRWLCRAHAAASRRPNARPQQICLGSFIWRRARRCGESTSPPSAQPTRSRVPPARPRHQKLPDAAGRRAMPFLTSPLVLPPPSLPGQIIKALMKWSKSSREPPRRSGLEHASHTQGPRERGSFSLEKERFRGDSEQPWRTCKEEVTTRVEPSFVLRRRAG